MTDLSAKKKVGSLKEIISSDLPFVEALFKAREWLLNRLQDADDAQGGKWSFPTFNRINTRLAGKVGSITSDLPTFHFRPFSNDTKKSNRDT
jgi:hypothetical protein